MAFSSKTLKLNNCAFLKSFSIYMYLQSLQLVWERVGSVVECRTPEREVGGSKPTAAVLCPWARHFTSRKYWLITQEAVAPSRHDWKIVDWDVKPQSKQTKSSVSCNLYYFLLVGCIIQVNIRFFIKTLKL